MNDNDGITCFVLMSVINTFWMHNFLLLLPNYCFETQTEGRKRNHIFLRRYNRTAVVGLFTIIIIMLSLPSAKKHLKQKLYGILVNSKDDDTVHANFYTRCFHIL